MFVIDMRNSDLLPIPKPIGNGRPSRDQEPDIPLTPEQLKLRKAIQCREISERGYRKRYEGKITVPERAHPLVKQFFRLMNKDGWLFTDVAKRSGLCRQSIAKFGIRERGAPKLDMLIAALNAIGYDLKIVPRKKETFIQLDGSVKTRWVEGDE